MLRSPLSSPLSRPLQSPLAARRGGGVDTGIVYDAGFELLDLSTQTVVNLTDSATPNATRTKVDGNLQIALSTGSRRFAWSTENIAGTIRTRIQYQASCTFSTACGVGFALFDGTVNRCAFIVSSNGRFSVVNNRSGGGTGLISTTLPTFSTGAVITIECVHDAQTETAYLAIRVNGGPPDVFGIGNAPAGRVEVVQESSSTVQHGLVLSFASGAVSNPAISAQIADAPAGPLAAVVSEFLGASKSRPSGFTAEIPSGFLSYPFHGDFVGTAEIQPVLSESDPTVTVIHVDRATGADTNPGTIAQPLRSLRRAGSGSQIGARVIIKANGGLYGGDDCFGNADIKGSVVQIISWDGLPVVSSKHFDGLSWALHSGTTYAATFSGGVSLVFDASILTPEGDYTRMALATSLANCEATAGTHWIASTTIYVHLPDGRAPDAALRVYRKGVTTENDNNLRFVENNQIVYLQGIHAEGGTFPFSSRSGVNTHTHAVYAKDCTFKYGGSNGVNENFSGLFVLQRCLAAWNRSDGFNYKSSPFGGSAPIAIEVDCVGRYNGWDTDGTNNGTTTHNAGVMVRVRGEHHHNQNRNVHDIDNALSWAIGLVSRDSRGPANSVNFAAGIGGADTTRMWLDACESSGSTSDLEANGTSSRISTSALVSGGVNIGTGTIDSYTP
jgi:hypothetical protein